MEEAVKWVAEEGGRGGEKVEATSNCKAVRTGQLNRPAQSAQPVKLPRTTLAPRLPCHHNQKPPPQPSPQPQPPPCQHQHRPVQCPTLVKPLLRWHLPSKFSAAGFLKVRPNLRPPQSQFRAENTHQSDGSHSSKGGSKVEHCEFFGGSTKLATREFCDVDE